MSHLVFIYGRISPELRIQIQSGEGGKGTIDPCRSLSGNNPGYRGSSWLVNRKRGSRITKRWGCFGRLLSIRSSPKYRFPIQFHSMSSLSLPFHDCVPPLQQQQQQHCRHAIGNSAKYGRSWRFVNFCSCCHSTGRGDWVEGWMDGWMYG